jgi:predicted N-acetyltransferase YhbS
VDVRYAVNGPLAAEEFAALCRRSGLRRPVDDMPRMERMLRFANLVLTARDEAGRLLGAARAVTDFSYCCYVSDLAVEPEAQKKGIGRDLMRRLGEHLGEEVAVILLAGSQALEYYPKIGFEKADAAWMIRRKR